MDISYYVRPFKIVISPKRIEIWVPNGEWELVGLSFVLFICQFLNLILKQRQPSKKLPCLKMSHMLNYSL